MQREPANKEFLREKKSFKKRKSKGKKIEVEKPKRQEQRVQSDNDQTFMREEKNNFFLLASYLVLLSGIMCFFLERNWTEGFPYLLKVPVYVIVAMSLNYLILFAIIDFVNYICSYAQSQNSLNVVESQDQILTLLINCFGCGLLYGLIFSLIDVEDAHRQELRKKFIYEEGLCIPIGIIGGIIGGIANEVLRHNVE